jgi:uncharacterized protein YcaQ
MVLQLSYEQAAGLLARYHFTPTDLAGVFERLGTVQYDPLSPVGRNPDLVLQARVHDYQVDDWQAHTYNQRFVYDAWDKQACLVPVSDWPLRALIRQRYRPYHDRDVLLSEVEKTSSILAALDERGPLSSLDFEHQVSDDNNSWYGATMARRILRSLWASGEIVTHHRRAGRHYYDRSSRVIPAEYFNQPPLLDEAAYSRWIIGRRHQAVGLLRTGAEATVWSSCGGSALRKQALRELVEAGSITPVQIGEKQLLYYAYTEALKQLDEAPLPARVLFLGPLDSLLWDRKSLQQIFGFDYLWEVYKPEHLRKWGYYVLPVFYGQRFVARLDSHLEKGIWIIERWWWEADVTPDEQLLQALQEAMAQFLQYLRADGLRAAEGVDQHVLRVVQKVSRS